MLLVLLLLAGLALWAYCLVESITTDESLVRNLPKVAWVFVILFFPLVGSIAWLALGRPSDAPMRAPRRPPAPPRRRQRPPVGPEDAPEYRRWIEQQRRGDDDQPRA